MMVGTCVGIGITMAGIDRLVDWIRSSAARPGEPTGAPASRPEPEILQQTVALLALSDEEFARNAQIFVRQAAGFPGDPRLIGGCIRLARYAATQDGRRADAFMRLAIMGLDYLGAREQIEQFKPVIYGDARYVETRELLQQQDESRRGR
jgi:hypothetical protein